MFSTFWYKPPSSFPKSRSRYGLSLLLYHCPARKRGQWGLITALRPLGGILLSPGGGLAREPPGEEMEVRQADKVCRLSEEWWRTDRTGFYSQWYFSKLPFATLSYTPMLSTRRRNLSSSPLCLRELLSDAQTCASSTFLSFFKMKVSELGPVHNLERVTIVILQWRVQDIILFVELQTYWPYGRVRKKQSYRTGAGEL